MHLEKIDFEKNLESTTGGGDIHDNVPWGTETIARHSPKLPGTLSIPLLYCCPPRAAIYSTRTARYRRGMMRDTAYRIVVMLHYMCPPSPLLNSIDLDTRETLDSSRRRPTAFPDQSGAFPPDRETRFFFFFNADEGPCGCTRFFVDVISDPGRRE